jgi:hypothetical protein
MPDSLECLIESIDPRKHRREELDCGVEVLNDYLKKRARKAIEAGLAVCIVAVPEHRRDARDSRVTGDAGNPLSYGEFG